MPKHYKEMMDELINKIDEDAPANAVGDGGNVALPPKHEPGVKKDKRKEIDPLMYAKPLKRKIKESDDNNNVVLRGVIEKIENIEQALDEKLNGKTEFKIEDIFATTGLQRAANQLVQTAKILTATAKLMLKLVYKLYQNFIRRNRWG